MLSQVKGVKAKVYGLKLIDVRNLGMMFSMQKRHLTVCHADATVFSAVQLRPAKDGCRGRYQSVTAVSRPLKRHFTPPEHEEYQRDKYHRSLIQSAKSQLRMLILSAGQRLYCSENALL